MLNSKRRLGLRDDMAKLGEREPARYDVETVFLPARTKRLISIANYCSQTS